MAHVALYHEPVLHDTSARDDWPFQRGGSAATQASWPLAPDDAVDVWFPKRDDAGGKWDAGWFRGTVDTATPAKPGPQQKQTVVVDFPDELTHTELRVSKADLLEPRDTADAPPEAGEVAVAAAPVQADVTSDGGATPFGLTAAQEAKLHAIWYGGHYAAADRMWELVRASAKKSGAAPFFGIKQRQMKAWLRSQEAAQLFKIPRRVKTFRPFILPSTPLKTLQVDTMDLGRFGGKADAKQRWVISAVDTASRWVHSEIFGARAPRPQDSVQMVRDAMVALRSGPLKHVPGAKGNVFGADGALLHVLTIVTDNGNEFGGKAGGASYGDKLYAALSVRKGAQAPLLAGRERLKHRYNLASAPTQAAFIERWNGTLRQKLRLAVQAEQGNITRSTAADTRRAAGWKPMLARVVRAANEEVAAGTKLTPLDYLERHVRDGRQPSAASKGDDKVRGASAQRALAAQEALTVGTRVRLIDLAREKAELLGSKKMQQRWSSEIYTVSSVNKRTSTNTSFLYGLERANGAAVDGRYKLEQLQVVPVLSEDWYSTPIKGKWRELREAGTAPEWKVRDGSSWAEKIVDAIPGDERAGLRYEQVLQRLVSYLRQGMPKEKAKQRLLGSLAKNAGGANPGKLAVLGKNK